MTEGAPSQTSRELGNTSYLAGNGDMHDNGGGTYTNAARNPTIEDYENIFGPAARDIKMDAQRHRRHQRWHLPDALRGVNPWLTDRIDGLIANGTTSPFTTLILPYQYVEQPDQKLKWNRWSFDEGMASRVPYESAARVLTQSKRSYSGYIVRYGLAISLEHNFMMSEAGRKNFQDQVQQMVGCIQYTNDLDVHVALLQAPSYAKHVAEKFYSTPKTNHQIIREYIDLFGFVQKNPNAMSILIEEAKNTFASWGAKDPTFLLLNQKLTFQLTMTPEKTSYITQGIDGVKRLRDGPNIPKYRGLDIIRSRAFSMETGAPPRDILRRRVRVAEYYRIPAKYALDGNEIELYDEARDAFFRVTMKTLRKKATIERREIDEWFQRAYTDAVTRTDNAAIDPGVPVRYQDAVNGMETYFNFGTDQTGTILANVPAFWRMSRRPDNQYHRVAADGALALSRYALTRTVAQSYITGRLDKVGRAAYALITNANIDRANLDGMRRNNVAIPLIEVYANTLKRLRGVDVNVVDVPATERQDNTASFYSIFTGDTRQRDFLPFCPNYMSRPDGIARNDNTDMRSIIETLCNNVFTRMPVYDRLATLLMKNIPANKLSIIEKAQLDSHCMGYLSGNTVMYGQTELVGFLDEYNPYTSVVALVTLQNNITSYEARMTCQNLLRKILRDDYEKAIEELKNYLLTCLEDLTDGENTSYAAIGKDIDDWIYRELQPSSYAEDPNSMHTTIYPGNDADKIQIDVAINDVAEAAHFRDRFQLDAILNRTQVAILQSTTLHGRGYQDVVFSMFMGIMFKRFMTTGLKSYNDCAIQFDIPVRQIDNDDAHTGDIVIVRPNIEHNMLSVVMGRGGMEDLGATLWGGTELACFDDSMHGIWGMSYKYSQKAMIWEEKSLQRFYDISYDGYNGGKDNTFIEWADSDSVDAFTQATNDTSRAYEGPSMMVMSFKQATRHADYAECWPNPIVFHDNTQAPNRTSYPIDPENIHSVANIDASMRVFAQRGYSEEYMKYFDKMPDFSGLHVCRKSSGDASISNETCCSALAFEGCMRVYEAEKLVYQQKGSGHHGTDYVGAASVRAGKGFMPQYDAVQATRYI